MVLDSIAWYWMVLDDIRWHCIVVFYCMLLNDLTLWPILLQLLQYLDMIYLISDDILRYRPPYGANKFCPQKNNNKGKINVIIIILQNWKTPHSSSQLPWDARILDFFSLTRLNMRIWNIYFEFKSKFKQKYYCNYIRNH